MDFNLKQFPDNLVILPGSNKFPNTGGWQKVRKTPKRGWESKSCTQAILLCGQVSGVTCIDVDDDVAWYDAFCLHH